MTTSSGTGWKRIAAGLVFELVVVFVGVYGASALASHQERQREEAQKDQIRHALILEINDITRQTKYASCQLHGYVTFMQAAQKAGKNPVPQPMLSAIRVQQHMWQATLASGGMDLFDVPTFFRMSEFYNELNEGFAYLEQLSRMSEEKLVPVEGSPPSEYYDAPGKLKPKYAWYPMTIERVAAAADATSAKGDTLVALLGNGKTGGAQKITQRSCPATH